jgi:hypothetical protein
VWGGEDEESNEIHGHFHQLCGNYQEGCGRRKGKEKKEEEQEEEEKEEEEEGEAEEEEEPGEACNGGLEKVELEGREKPEEVGKRVGLKGKSRRKIRINSRWMMWLDK